MSRARKQCWVIGARKGYKGKKLPLENMLSEIYPKFNLDLRNPRVVVDRNPLLTMESGYSGGLDYTHRPNLFDKKETKYLDGITFRVPAVLSEDPQLVRAYFAHECSHLELLKRPYHIGYFIALTLVNRIMRPIQEISQGIRESPKSRLECTKSIAGIGLRLAGYIPLATYGNFVEKIVDHNVKSKGFEEEINALREKYPLKMFRGGQ